MSTTFSIYLHAHRIHVHQYGSGERLLLLFHGFGESGAGYGSLEGLLGKEYTVVVPDLPFHGETQWGAEPLDAGSLTKLVRLLLKRQGMKSCSLLGYSMGGRLALCLMQQAPSLIDRLLLVAPEGLRKNRWFRFATGTLTGQWLFRKMIFHPRWMICLANIGRKAGWISKARSAFVAELMTSEAARLQVYRCWMCFSKLHPRINGHPFTRVAPPPHFYFGKYDRLIPPPSEAEICKWSPAKISILSTGHLLFLHAHLLKEIYTYLCAPAKHK